MPILNLNGWSVPLTHPKADLSDDEVGSQQRAASGNLIATRNAVRQKGDFETVWTDPQTVNALRELIRGRGDRFPFSQGLTNQNVLGTVGSAAYSAKGLYPAALQGCALRGAELNPNSFTAPYFGSSCLAIEPGMTNYLPTANAACASTSGFAAGSGTTLTHNNTGTPNPPLPQSDNITVQKLIGGAPSISMTGVSPNTNGTTYIFSAYALGGTNGQSLTLNIIDSGTTVATQTVTLSATTWTRLQASYTAQGRGVTLQLIAAGIGTFYTAGWQWEAKAASAMFGTATSWGAGQGSGAGANASRAVPQLKYALQDLRGVDDLTLMAWIAPNSPPGGTNLSTLFYLSSNAFGSGNEAACYIDSSLIAHFTTGDDLTYQLPNTLPPWSHLVATLQRTQTGGVKSIYLNGALVAQGTTTKPCGWGDYPPLFLGTDASYSNVLNALVDEVVALPFAATASMISAWYTRQFSNLPVLSVGGDGLFGFDSAPLSCVGKVSKLTQQSAVVSGTPSGLARKLNFTLQEV